MKLTGRTILLLTLWLAGLGALGVYVQRHLSVGNDLRLFLPEPTTPEQRLLLQEVGEGPASRVLVIALAGAQPARLADVSRLLAESLRDSPAFRFVTNGTVSPDELPDELLPYRFLLSPTIDTQTFDAAYLHSQLEARARDLASPASLFLEPLLPRDPTLEVLTVLERWQPMQQPRQDFDVWFDHQGRRALLVAETRAPAFDPVSQRSAISEIDGALADLGADGVTATISGSGAFSALMETRTRAEAQSLTGAASIGMILLILLAYRSFGCLLLSALPLASAGLVALVAVSALFGTVHGITLAFGFTLLGIAQDYPTHLLSHRRVDTDARDVARELWPTLALGIASTCLAYLTLLLSGVDGLAQLACFSVAGLAVAGLMTRFLLPSLVATPKRDYASSRVLARIWASIERFPRPAWAPAVLLLICLALMAVARQPLWENDLGKLTPVPADLLAQDQELRGELGTADLRYLLVVEAENAQAALTRLEALEPALSRVLTSGAITGYDHAARYVPTIATQLRRQARLPDASSLETSLRSALVGTPFREDAFQPFLADVALAKSAEPLTLDRLRDSPMGARVEMLLAPRDDSVSAFVTFSGVKNVDMLRKLAADAGPDVTLLDIKDAAETLVAEHRTIILETLGIAFVLLVVVIAAALRRAARVWRVIAPMALTTLIVIALLRVMGVSMNLFHLIALTLAAGIGLDYALFFERAQRESEDRTRTLHAILVCALSTLMVFALLATSSLPVLRAIGLTVSIGVVSNFLLALLLTRPSQRETPRSRA
jgi:predicted exporter